MADELPYKSFHQQQRLSAKEEVGLPEEELASMLPPPSYGQDNEYQSDKRLNSAAGGGSGADSANSGKDRIQAAPRATSVRYSPLAAANNGNSTNTAANSSADVSVIPEEYAQYPTNYPRKAPTPSFPRPQSTRVTTPSGSQLDLQQPSSRGNSSKNLPRGITPESDSSKSGMEVVGMRHLRSPSGNPPAGAPGRGGLSAQSNSNPGVDSESRTVSDLLEQLLGESIPARSALAQRLQSLKLLRLLWERGEINDCIDHLVVLSDTLSHNSANLATLADFFDAAELRGNGLSLDSCVRLLPVLESMLVMERGFPSEHVMYATFKSFTSLATGFGDLIRNTRATIVISGGVDLSREERLNKCNACFEVFSRVAGRIDQFKRQYRASRSTVDILDVFRDQSVRYFH